MTETESLSTLLSRAAREAPDRSAVEEVDGGSITYSALEALTDRIRDRLSECGVRLGDRVGIYLPKSIDGVASILGALKAGAAYVPVDPLAPASRNAYILHDCEVKVAIVERRFADRLREEFAKLGATPIIWELDGVGEGRAISATLDGMASHPSAASRGQENLDAAGPDDLAYLLYTSGSTGKPKGVKLTHRNALCFVDWCSDVFQPQGTDRFSSHAPFHFDLSILDLYVSLKHAATVVLIGEELGKEPLRLATAISEKRISIWYSAPSILSMLAQQGQLPKHDYSNLRMVLFAGEVFPVKHLQALKALWPEPRYFNLYGPTETNVCTWHEIPASIPADREDPYPIGKVCAHYDGQVVDADGQALPADAEGELCIAGPGVMQGYWNLPSQDERVFLVGADGRTWYRTGDIVALDSDGDYKFLGRRDRMIKKRGYRVELGEIEAALYGHPQVKEVAVIATSGDEGVRVRGYLTTKDGNRLSLIELKRFCAERLPLYMVPDEFRFLETLPKTSTDKVHYQALKEMD